MTEQSQWEKAARQLNDDMKQLAPKMAADFTPAPGMSAVSPHRERQAYWQRAITPDEEAMLWQETIGAAMAEGLTYEDAVIRATPRIAITVYPGRAPLIRQGDRKLSVDKQIAYGKMQERLGPPDTEGGESYG